MQNTTKHNKTTEAAAVETESTKTQTSRLAMARVHRSNKRAPQQECARQARVFRCTERDRDNTWEVLMMN